MWRSRLDPCSRRRRDIPRSEAFSEGDGAIRARLDELARSRGLAGRAIELRETELQSYEYRVEGTDLSVAFRAKEIRAASDPDVLSRRIEPRLRAMFEEIWWRQAVILMTQEPGGGP